MTLLATLLEVRTTLTAINALTPYYLDITKSRLHRNGTKPSIYVIVKEEREGEEEEEGLIGIQSFFLFTNRKF